MKYLVKTRRAVVIYETALIEVEAVSAARAKACAQQIAVRELRGGRWKCVGSPRYKVSKIEIEGETA